MQLYWDLGRLIAERQQQGWGKSVVETLARDLQTEFVGMSGFSARNLWYMPDFHQEASPCDFSHKLCEKSQGLFPGHLPHSGQREKFSHQWCENFSNQRLEN